MTDQTGAVLPGVTLTVSNQQTNIKKSVVTDVGGNYTLVQLNPALYRLEAELPGFKKFVQPDIALGVDQVGGIDIRLQIGQVSEIVQVTGEAPVLNTENATKGPVIHNQEIMDLPLESRDFYDLTYLTVGVIPEPEGGQGGFASINGARQDSMNYIVDGGNNSILRAGDATVRPSLDAVQEFRVQTSNYSAEYGRRSTGVISMLLRSETNAFSGLLFHFHNSTTMIKGQHNIRFGSEMIRTQFFQLFANNARGLFNFRDRWTGEPFADFLNPIRQSLGQNPPFTIRENYSRDSKNPEMLTWNSPFPPARRSREHTWDGGTTSASCSASFSLMAACDLGVPSRDSAALITTPLRPTPTTTPYRPACRNVVEV